MRMKKVAKREESGLKRIRIDSIFYVDLTIRRQIFQFCARSGVLIRKSVGENENTRVLRTVLTRSGRQEKKKRKKADYLAQSYGPIHYIADAINYIFFSASSSDSCFVKRSLLLLLLFPAVIIFLYYYYRHQAFFFSLRHYHYIYIPIVIHFYYRHFCAILRFVIPLVRAQSLRI